MRQSTQRILQRQTFADNQRVTVADAIRAQARHRNNEYAINIATGYFNLGGFTTIADVLEAAPSVRVLIGAEPEPETVPDKLEVDRDDPLRAIRRIEQAIISGRDETPFTAQNTAAIQRLRHFLGRGTTQVRLYRKRFLHGKAFLFGNDEAVIAGSANFTYAGLNRNLELDLGQYSPPDVRLVSDWYEALWDNAEPYDLANIFNVRLAQYDPHTIYLRMLYAQYSPEIHLNTKSQAIFGTVQLAEFQKIGSERAVRILDRWGGAILADGVGLGKTIIAGDIVRTFAVERGLRVLIVCPAALREMWRRFLAKQNLPGDVLSYSQLAQESQITGGNGNALLLPPKQYRLIVADEAHALRNPDIGAYKAMISLLAKSPDAKLLLLTATPVNNSLWDLYHEVMLFAKTDSAFESVGIANLRSHVKHATSLDHDDLDPAHMFAVLDAISVRRTRHFIKTHFPGATIDGKIIVFPKIVPHAEKYDLDAVIPGLFEDVADAIEHRLHMARYRTQAYALDPNLETARQEFLSGLLRSQMLKRFESSAYAFRKTLEKMIDAHYQCRAFIEESGMVPLITLSAEELHDGDEIDLLVENGQIGESRDYDVELLCKDLSADISTLEELHSKIIGFNAKDDPKLANLVAIIREAASKPTTDKRKTLVFTSFVDTVRYIKEHLEELASRDILIAGMVARAAYVLGAQETDVDTRAALACGFAPHSMRPEEPDAEDLYDLLVTTDVLAEGQNLQQCGRVVNFDLPWNPMRVAQRNGRIDRIGSPHDYVDMHCFMPDAQLDEVLHLEERLLRKIAHANAGVGVEGTVIPGIASREQVFVDLEGALSERSDQVRKLAAEQKNILEILDRDDAYSGEQFREELRQALLSEAGRDIEKLPWGIGSGHHEGINPSVVFLAKAGRLQFFRKVVLAAETIHTDLLDSLKTARCGFNAEREYPEELRGTIYDAWERVRLSIFTSLQELRDPAKTHTSLPKAQREAIDLLQRSANGLAADAVDVLVAIWPTDVERSLRQILRDETITDSIKVDQIIKYIAQRGLRPQAQEEILEVREVDIKLVCYQLVLPQGIE